MHRVSAPIAPPSQITASRLTASKYSSNLARSWTRSASPNPIDHGLQLYLLTRSITASKFAQSWPPSAYFQSRSITASKSMSQLARSRPPGESPNLLDHGLPVHLQTQSITASDYISKQITASKCFSKLARLSPLNVSLSSLDHGVVKWWSLLAASPSSTLRCTSYGIQREFLRKSGSCWRRVGRGWEDMKGYPAMMNHTNCVDPWMLGKSAWGTTHCMGLWMLGNSAWDQELGKIECIFCIVRWCLSTQGSAKYVLPVAESIAICIYIEGLRLYMP